MTIVGILAGLAIPNLRTILLRARATELAGDMEVVRVAVLSYNAEHQAWPSEALVGSIPAGLAPFLPDAFVFDKDLYSLDFENWSLPGGLPGDPAATQIIGVSVVVPDEQLGNALIELLGSAILFSAGGRHTIVISRS
jgi:type II secretory pathway pseudopilin PulG